MSWIWSDKARSMILPTSNENFMVGDVLVNYTQVIGFAFGVVVTIVTAAFLRYTKLGTAMRALANDREITATLGVPVRRVEAAAWLGSGLLAGVAGLLLSNLVGLDADTLTFLVISSLAAALIARLQSLVVTLLAGHRRRPGQRPDHADPLHLRLPGHDALRARDRRAAVAVAAPRGVVLERGRIGMAPPATVDAAEASARSRFLKAPGRATRGDALRAVVIVALLLFVLLAVPVAAERVLAEGPHGRRHLLDRRARAERCSWAGSAWSRSGRSRCSRSGPGSRPS